MAATAVKQQPKKVTPGRPLGKPAGAATRGRGGQGLAVGQEPATAPDPSGGAHKAPGRRGFTPLTPMRAGAAKSMTKLADSMKESHPDMLAHQHVRDAARMLRAGQEEAAQRHLRAAMFAMTPQSLLRHGLHTDDAHTAARNAMHGIHRHLLLVKDIADVNARNQAALHRDSYGDDSTSNPLPEPAVHAGPNAGYGPGALAQKPTARQPPGNQALNAPNQANGGGSDPGAADPDSPQPRGSKQFAYRWDDLSSLIEMSARTAQLEHTPAPRGKPGGPGLYDVKDLQHTPYFQNVVKALIEKRGMPPAKAYAIAYGALRKWARGGGNVHPEVAAAATGALAGEKAKGAMARQIHGHAVTWDDVAAVIGLAASWNEALHPRAPQGQANGGQFAAGGGGNGPAAGQQAPAGKAPAKGAATAAVKPAAKPGTSPKPAVPKQTAAQQAHAAHVAHVAHTQGVSTQKAQLLVTAQDDRQKADGLIKQRDALVKALASAAGKTSRGQAGAKTASTAKTKSTAAPKAGAAKAGKAAPAKGTSPAPKKAGGTAKTAKGATGKTAKALVSVTPKAGSTAAIKQQIAQLNTQIAQLLAQAEQATLQAQGMQ